jgi:hypothetical protein
MYLVIKQAQLIINMKIKYTVHIKILLRCIIKFKFIFYSLF